MTATPPSVVPLNCWNEIGVKGDRTCPELPNVTHCRNCPVYASAGQRLFDRPPPDGYADEWAEALARPEDGVCEKTYPVVVFRLADEWLALDVQAAVEVAPVRTVRRIPHRSDAVLAGLVNIRGDLQPAFHLQQLIGVQDGSIPPDPSRRRLLVSEGAGRRWVFLVDEVTDVRHLTESLLRPAPVTVGTGAGSFSRGVFVWEGRAIGYLDAGKVFAALERSFR